MNKSKSAESQHKWWLKNKEKQMQRVKKNRSRLRKLVYEEKLGKACVDCGYGETRALQFHHPDPSKKKFSISSACCKGISWEKIKQEIDTCVILCANCHILRHCTLEY